MKKSFKIFLATLLALTTIFSVACDGGVQEASSSSSVGGDGSVTSSVGDSSLDSSAEDSSSVETVDPDEEVEVTGTVLAKNGATDYKIVVPFDGDDAVNYAARELKKYFEQATGANIPIIDDNGLLYSSSSKYISLGNTVLKEQAGISSVTKQQVNLDGFRMIRKDECLFVFGYNSRGVIYGAYEFLHKTFGYEYYAIGEYSLEKKSTSYLIDVNYTDAPTFEGRHIDGAVYGSADAMSKYRFKGGVGFAEQYQVNESHEWLAGANCHSFHTFLPPYSNKDKTEGLRIDHPAWFGTAGQICFTNEEALDALAASVISYLEETPDVLYVNIGEEDWNGQCQCTNADLSFNGTSCKETMEKYGVGGQQVRWMNELVSRVEAWREVNYPDKDWDYVTFAYHETLTAPVKKNEETGKFEAIDETVIPHEKLYIRYAPIERCFLHEYYDDTCSVNLKFATAWEGWTAITDHLMVWDYAIDFSNYLVFFDKFGTLQNEYKEYAEEGVTNVIIQYTSGGTMGAFRDLTYYLNSKLMWNVNLDVNVLIENFMNAYYKEAAPYMKEYLNLMRRHLAAMDAESKRDGTPFHMGMYDYVSPNYKKASTWKQNVLEKGMSLIDQAYDAVKDLDTATRMVLENRLLQESVCLRAIILNNYSDYYNIYASAYLTAITQWEMDLKALDVTQLSEGMGVSTYIKSLRAKVGG